MESKFVNTNGIKLHVKVSGPEDGELLIFLHGFPEFWKSWEYIGKKFAECGYRVLIPDQRGYNLSDRPKKINAYKMKELTADILGLIKSEKREKATVIGHDWGAAVTWALAANHGDNIKKAAVLNVPHPDVFLKEILTNPKQLRSSWYMFFMQLPFLPEKIWSFKNFKHFAKATSKGTKNHHICDLGGSDYVKAWSQKGAFTGMLNWYRAAFRSVTYNYKSPIKVPTLVIWGEKDPFVRVKMAAPSLKYCQNGRLHLISKASHFVHHDAPDEVYDTLKDFIN
ncbi:MAG: alpha/beta hydrolase [Bacteriovoracaceae bacterium]|jgi:epoxide hydrolase 4|nr:alpha/beta hydrolase [Bacteriovoracaceae bacterium]